MDVARPTSTVAITVRGLDREIKSRLQARAKSNGRSMEAEAREILERETRPAHLPLELLSENARSHLTELAERSGSTVEIAAVEILERASRRGDAATLMYEITRKYGGFETAPITREVETHRIPEA